MPSIAEQSLAGGAIRHVDAVHGDRVFIVSGPDAGKAFRGVVKTEGDQDIASLLGQQVLGRVLLYFRADSPQPVITPQTVLQAKGRVWTAVQQPRNSFLTVDYELTEVPPTHS